MSMKNLAAGGSIRNPGFVFHLVAQPFGSSFQLQLFGFISVSFLTFPTQCSSKDEPSAQCQIRWLRWTWSPSQETELGFPGGGRSGTPSGVAAHYLGVLTSDVG